MKGEKRKERTDSAFNIINDVWSTSTNDNGGKFTSRRAISENTNSCASNFFNCNFITASNFIWIWFTLILKVLRVSFMIIFEDERRNQRVSSFQQHQWFW